jgi:hypothetical protein
VSLIQFITESTLKSVDEVGIPLKTFLDTLHSLARLTRKRSVKSSAPQEKVSDYSKSSVSYSSKFA